MKTKISLLLVLFAVSLNAQIWNRTYDINGNDDYLSPSFVVSTSDLGCVSVSWGLDAPWWPRQDYFILTKHDANGNVVFNNRYNPAGTPNDGFTHVKALLETPDRGILVAGYYYDAANFAMQPFLMKVDAGGGYQWTRYYPSSFNNFIGYQFDKISLCRVEDDDEENYFIVSSAESDARPVNDAVICVTKVRADGSTIWVKKYYDNNLSNFSTLRDCPGDIAFAPEYRMYMLTGWRQQWAPWFQEDRIFFFAIDRDGNPMTPYKYVDVPGYPFGEDMIWDPNTNRWAVTYTHGNTNYSGNPNVVSGIGLITIEPSMNIPYARFYWHDEGYENYGVSISLARSGDYVIGCFVYEGGEGGGGGLNVRNPALLKVDNNGVPIWFWRYNRTLDEIFGHHCNAYNTNTGDEEYVLIAEYNKDLTVIRTDVNGKSECAFEYTPKYKKVKPVEEKTEYYPKEDYYFVDYTPKTWNIDPPVWKCEELGGNNRPALVAGVDNVSRQTGIALFPSVLKLTEANFKVTNNSGEELKLLVTDITGKLVAAEQVVPTGSSTIKLNGSGNLTAGVYLVKLSSDNGNVSDVRKIILTE